MNKKELKQKISYYEKIISDEECTLDCIFDTIIRKKIDIEFCEVRKKSANDKIDYFEKMIHEKEFIFYTRYGYFPDDNKKK